MIRGVGIDAAEIPRFEKNIEEKAFCDRVFTVTELAYINKKGASKAQSAAACFAAKEATLKAFGTGMGPLSLLDVWVDHEDSGKALPPLFPKAMEKLAELGAERTHLSITHTGACHRRRDPRRRQAGKIRTDVFRPLRNPGKDGRRA